MALTAAERIRLQQLIAKRDALIGGGNVKRVSHGQRSAEMETGNADALQAEIDRLESAGRSGSRRRRGSITFRFGC